MNKNLKLLFSAVVAATGALPVFGQDLKPKNLQDSIQKELAKEHKLNKGTESNDRNVLLNAANNTSPREVNIGLPSSVGGITILENDLPVVYFFWPELPSKTWRNSVGLESVGLLKMDQMSLTMGDLGFAVNSYAQTGTEDFKLKAKLTGSHFGWLQGDVNVSGPITQNGWTFTAGAFLNYDPSTFKLGFNRNVDETKIFRAGITKYFDNEKGKITALYKYSDSYNIGNYAVFEYGEGGKVKELSDFQIGKDSYVVRDGKYKMLNSLTGEYYWGSMAGNDNATKAHNLDIFGNYRLNNGWDFKYSTRFHTAKVSLATLIPLSIFSVTADDGYKIAETGEAYSGNVGTELAMHTPETSVTNLQGRFSLNKKFEGHDLTIGLLQQYFNIDQFTSNRSFFFQTVGDQPQRLTSPNTDADGFYNYNVGAEYHDGYENKLSLYANDNWQATDNLHLKYGAIIRHNIVNGNFSTTERYSGFTFVNDAFTKIDHQWLQLGGAISATYNVSKQFGLIGNFQYNEENRRLESYSQAYIPNTDKIRSPLGALGIFWNTDWIQLVSQATYLERNGYLARYNLVNPSNSTDAQVTSVDYSIKTLGWTTDFVLNPFKGFNLHYLLTLQSPEYNDFKFEAFGTDYDYNGNIVVGVSKVLMEIDPSYTFDKWRFWTSFRYFSKQYANLTNVLYFAPRWETFSGINYTLNKNINLGATVTNFLNQRGASGTINGAELITDASPYYGSLLTGNYIMPFTAQFSVGINF